MTPITPKMSDSQRKLVKKLKELVVEHPFVKNQAREWLVFISKTLSMYDNGKVGDSKSPAPVTSATPPPVAKENNADPLVKEVEKKTAQRFALDIPRFVDDLKLKFNKPEVPKIPKWKTRLVKYTQDGINIKTAHILAQVVATNNPPVRLKRMEELFSHLMQYPLARYYAVNKLKAISEILRLRSIVSDEASHQIIRQILAILGRADPPKSAGIRILSIDGGGMRGIAVVKMLQKIEKLTGKRVIELFDFICGVSTGAIITSCLVPPHEMSLDAVYGLYQNLSSKVFKQSAFWGTSKLVWSHAYYDTELWENILKEYVGETRSIDTAKYRDCPKFIAVSTIVNHHKVAPYIFRNYANPCNRNSEYLGSHKHLMFEAVRASAAAPTIFGEFTIGGFSHQDGGMVVNNPTAVAIHEAKTLWPDETISCVVSCGTGRYNPEVVIEDDTAKDISTSWKQVFDKILASATDTEGVHTVLNDLLPENVYFRLNPYLSKTVTMDEANQENISILEEDTEMYCRRNEDKLNEVAKKLLLPRSELQRCLDYVNLQAKIRGGGLI